MPIIKMLNQPGRLTTQEQRDIERLQLQVKALTRLVRQLVQVVDRLPGGGDVYVGAILQEVKAMEDKLNQPSEDTRL